MNESIADQELIARADGLREKAKRLLLSHGLLACFAEAEAVEVVGSVATGLMTRPDIDIACCLNPLESRRVLIQAARVVENFPVGRMTYINPSVTPWHDYVAGLYFNARLQITPDNMWNVDVWSYSPEGFDDAMESHRGLASQVGKIDRLTLLRLKSSCDQQAYLVYAAVLEHGVRTVEELNDYLRAHAGLTTF